MEIYDVIGKLVGPIDPVGESNTDARRLNNLKVQSDLTYRLVQSTIRVFERNRHSHEGSVRLSAETARKYIDGLREDVSEVGRCNWYQGGGGGSIWTTGCDDKFIFDEDGPDEHKFAYCHFCGLRLESHYQAPPTEDENDD